MAKAPLLGVVRHIRKIVDVQMLAEATDGQLVERFVRDHEEAAFAVLLRRHGPMVLGVCRGVLGQREDAEDVFQATFLLFARKASSIRKRESVAGWLHGVAYRLAVRAKQQRALRRSQEIKASTMSRIAPSVEAAWQELRPLLHEEMEKLPEKYRAALVLFYFEGKTQEEVARELGCPVGTVQSRLGRGRKLLQERLSRRGLDLSVGSFAAFLVAATASETVRAQVLDSTLKACLQFGSAAAPVAALVEEGLKAMFLTKLKIATALLLAVSFVAGAGALAHQVFEAKPLEAKQATAPGSATEEPNPRVPGQPHTDLHGDPLPAGAVARMGTARFRHPGSFRGILTFSSDGKTLISGSILDGVVRVWDPVTGKQLRRLATFPEEVEVQDLVLSPDHKLVAAANYSNTVGIWEFSSGKALRQSGIQGSGPAVRLCFSADAKTLAVAERDQVEISFWDTGSGQLLRRMRPEGNAQSITGLAFLPEGDRLLAKSPGGVLHFWDATTGKETRRFRRSGNNLSPSYAFAADGKTFAFGEDRSVVLWDMGTEQEVGRLQSGGRIEGVALSPDGKSLAAASSRSVQLWNTTSRRVLRLLGGFPEGGVYLLCFSPNGKSLVSTGDSSAIRLWDVATGQEFQQQEGHWQGVYHAAFSKDGLVLATLGWDRRLCLWESATGKLLRTIEGAGEAILFGSDGKTLVSSDDGGIIRFLETATGKELRRFVVPSDVRKRESHQIMQLAVSLDGRRLTAITRSSSYDGQGPGALYTLTLSWDLDTGEQTLRRCDPAHSFPRAILSPDGSLAAFTSGAAISLYDARTGQQVLSLDGKCEGVFPVVFSPDGRIVAGVCHHGLGRAVTVILWELATGTEIHQFKPSLKGVHTPLAFSPDGSVLAVAGPDKAGVQLWDLITLRDLAGYAGSGTTATSLRFSGDGRKLASGLLDGTALLWDTAGVIRHKLTRETVLAAEELHRVWLDLGKEDAATGQKALWILAVRSKQAIRFLKSRLQPAAEPDPKRLHQLLADLDSNQFAVREAAAKELEQQRHHAQPLLREALAGQPSTEARKRIETILARPKSAPSGDTLRRLRAIQALEYIGSAEARDLLDFLAGGSPAAWETQEAKASLERLAKRAATTP